MGSQQWSNLHEDAIKSLEEAGSLPALEQWDPVDPYPEPPQVPLILYIGENSLTLHLTTVLMDSSFKTHVWVCSRGL